MKPKLVQRVLLHASLILNEGATIRSVSKITRICKSSVHEDLSKRLYDIDRGLYDIVSAKLQYNFSIKHINGGIATQNSFKRRKEGA